MLYCNWKSAYWKSLRATGMPDHIGCVCIINMRTIADVSILTESAWAYVLSFDRCKSDYTSPIKQLLSVCEHFDRLVTTAIAWSLSLSLRCDPKGIIPVPACRYTRMVNSPKPFRRGGMQPVWGSHVRV